MLTIGLYGGTNTDSGDAVPFNYQGSRSPL